MAGVVNLRLARKQRARAEKERLAAENRAVHGRARQERRATDDARAKALSHLEGHRLRPRGDAAD